MKKIITALLAVSLLVPSLISSAGAVTGSPSTINAGACILMEKETGTVLYEENADTQLEPASVTKVMTLLLIFEALDSGRFTLDDMVTVSAHAASMGGSQVFLEENEQMSVNDMLKAIVVSSGNDACVAMAEFIAGSEEGFVSMMNQRAQELGMVNTTFKNCTGLPAAGHVTTARDIAIMSRELILNHPAIRNYSTIWMDSLRDGAFQLANTNKLIRFYQGATGLKTGSTDSALYCLSATAERDGMELIAVILKAPTSSQRFETAKSLLDFGFANYELVDIFPSEALAPVDVTLGESSTVQPVLQASSKLLVDKSQKNSITTDVTLSDTVTAPVAEGQVLGEVTVSVDGEVRQTIPIVAATAVNRLTIPGIFKNFMYSLFSGN
ncbi:MAG: D-alanyl-D-alanine carboxypeptidase [Oscillospiraceae bacterium]|nr:D-alanyl-D-alanine carboxypeptidase [Oscillospiraceae bacterium]